MMMMNNSSNTIFRTNIPSSSSTAATSTTAGGTKVTNNNSSKVKTSDFGDCETVIKVMAKKPVVARTEQFSPTKGQVNDDEIGIRQSPLGGGDFVGMSSSSPTNDGKRSTSPCNKSNKPCSGCSCGSSSRSPQALRHKEKEIEKLRRDLTKCQSDLKEELERRGQSTSVRAACDRERSRLLKEIKELGVSKRRLESALEEASSALKKKTQEVRLVREAGKQEVASVERSCNLEVKKLLDDLKAKDHLLAVLDRNQYSDKSNQIKLIQKQQQESRLKNTSPNNLTATQLPPEGRKSLESPYKDPNPDSELQGRAKHPRKGEGTTKDEVVNLRKKISDLENQLSLTSMEKMDLEKQNKDIQVTKHNLETTIARLRDDNMQLNSDLNSVQYEVKRLNDALTNSNVEEMIVQFERLKNTTDVQEVIIRKLRGQLKKDKKLKSPMPTPEKSKKTVRFMLPGYSDPIVNGRVAYKEDMRYLFEDISDDDSSGYHDSEIRFYFESADDGQNATESGDNSEDDNNVEEKEEEEEEEDNSKDISQVKESLVLEDEEDDDGVPTANDEASMDVESEEIEPIEAVQPPSEEDYKLLMKEHLHLEQSVANLSQSLPPHDWSLEKESLQLAIMSLENKNHEYQTMVEGLNSKLEELREKNEELEFQVLEFEGSGNEVLKKEQEIADFALIERNSKLEQEIRALQVQLLHSSGSVQGTPRPEEDHLMVDEETQWNLDIDDEVVLEGECDQMSISENITTSISTSGFEDLSSDEEENSYDPMPHDEKTDYKSSGTEATDVTNKSTTNPEEYWIQLVKKLEAKLTCSKMRERQLKDRMALLCEEKNRIIRDFDRYTSDTDSLIELDSAIDVKSDSDDDFDPDDRPQAPRPRTSSAASCLRLDFSVDFSRASHPEDSFRIDTPTSGDLCFPKHVQSLTVEDETDALHQRVCHLEKDCELLKEIIDMDEGIIRDLQHKVDELEGSEKNLNQAVDRLECVEKVLRASESAAIEEYARLKVELTRSHSIEESLQSQLNLTKCDKTQLQHKLDEVLEELKQTELKLKKKSFDSEREKKELISVSEKLEDHVGELEAVVELLKRRNQNLQRLCEDTNTSLIGSENQCKKLKIQADCMEQQRDAFVARIQIMEKEKLVFSEKFNCLGKNLSDRTAELEMAHIEIRGLRACLNSIEQEAGKWMKKAEDRASVEVLLMKEIDELRVEKEVLDKNLRSIYMSSAGSQRKQIHQHSNETQTDSSFLILAEVTSTQSNNNGSDDDFEEHTIIANVDDDDDEDDVASMDDLSEEEQDHEDLPLDNDAVVPKCPKKFKSKRYALIKWGSVDTLWSRMEDKNYLVENSKSFMDKFTQTLMPLMPYLRKMQTSSLAACKLETGSSKMSLIPLSAKYFNQSIASTSYVSRPPTKINQGIQSSSQSSKTNLILDGNTNKDFPTFAFDSISDIHVSASSSCDGNTPVSRPPGPCASQ